MVRVPEGWWQAKLDEFMDSEEKRKLRFQTRAIHVGNEADGETGAIVPPIHVASTYVQPGPGEWGAYDYGRSGNPLEPAWKRRSLRSKVAAVP